MKDNPDIIEADLLKIGAVLFGGGCLAIITFIAVLGFSFERAREARYEDWVKLTGRADITLEEFKRLDKGGYLKGGRK
jgi:hypothetical protein